MHGPAPHDHAAGALCLACTPTVWLPLRMMADRLAENARSDEFQRVGITPEVVVAATDQNVVMVRDAAARLGVDLGCAEQARAFAFGIDYLHHAMVVSDPTAHLPLPTAVGMLSAIAAAVAYEKVDPT